jgi:hypothetical protein
MQFAMYNMEYLGGGGEAESWSGGGAIVAPMRNINTTVLSCKVVRSIDGENPQVGNPRRLSKTCTTRDNPDVNRTACTVAKHSSAGDNLSEY